MSKKGKRKKAIIIRGYKALGDLLYVSPIPRLMHNDGYDVDIACWNMNQQVFWNNPYVHEIKLFPDFLTDDVLKAYWKEWDEEYDVIVDLRGSIESKFLFRTDDEMPDLEVRREGAKGKNFYAETVKLTGYELGQNRPELYTTEEETAALEDFVKTSPKFAIWQLYGSSSAKQLINAPLWITEILKRVKDCKHYIVSDAAFSTKRLFGDGRVEHMGGRWGIRTAMLITKYAKLVVGPESVITNASGAFDVPKIICYSGSTSENLGAGFENHHAFYPKCECFPCYHISISPKEVWNMKKRDLARSVENKCRVQDPFDRYRYLGYRCTLTLPEEEIVNRAVEILNN